MAHQCDVLADQVLQNCRSTAEDWRFGHVPEEVLVANQERVIWGLGCSSTKNGLCSVWPFFRTGDLGRLSANGLELQGRMDEKVKISGEQCTAAIIHSFITRFPIRRSGALQQTFYGSPPACPVLEFPPPCN